LSKFGVFHFVFLRTSVVGLRMTKTKFDRMRYCAKVLQEFRRMVVCVYFLMSLSSFKRNGTVTKICMWRQQLSTTSVCLHQLCHFSQIFFTGPGFEVFL